MDECGGILLARLSNKTEMGFRQFTEQAQFSNCEHYFGFIPSFPSTNHQNVYFSVVNNISMLVN